MKKNDCFWLTSIRGQGATEYWCDRDDEECFDPDCDECMRYLSILSVRNTLKGTKTAEAEPTKHGRWIKCADVYSDGDYECSECHKRVWSETDYCPHCGAKMDLDEVEE